MTLEGEPFREVPKETTPRIEKSPKRRGRGRRQTKDCSQTWSFGFQFRLGKHFSDERGLAFYYLKIGFLEYLQISGEIRYPNGPIGYWKKATIWKEVCIVHVGAVIHDYQGEGASWSIKCLLWKDCPGDLTSNVNFCTRSRPYQREASRPSGPGRLILFSLPSTPQEGGDLVLADNEVSFTEITEYNIISLNDGRAESTGTRPDYLVNRVLTKNEGPHPEKIVRKSRNSCRVNSGGVGAHGQ